MAAPRWGKVVAPTARNKRASSRLFPPSSGYPSRWPCREVQCGAVSRRPTTEADYQQRLLRAQQLVQERLDEPIDPTALAGTAHFSLHHFHRIFRAQMGETI